MVLLLCAGRWSVCGENGKMCGQGDERSAADIAAVWAVDGGVSTLCGITLWQREMINYAIVEKWRKEVDDALSVYDIG